MKRIGVAKSGWNTYAFVFGPFWYISRGMAGKGTILLIIVLGTIGIGLIPIMIYCGIKGNSDLYKHLKGKGMYIY